MTVSLTATSAPPPSAKGLQSKGHGSAPRPGQRCPNLQTETKQLATGPGPKPSRWPPRFCVLALRKICFFFVQKPIVVQRCVVASEALTLDRRWLSAELSAAKPLSSALLNSQHIDLG